MKKIVFLLLLTVTFMSCNSGDNPASRIKDEDVQKAKQRMADMNKLPIMKFDYKEVDFGTHNEGDILDTVYTFTNTGEAPLVITKVKASCGCTTPYWPKKPINPGESEKIKVRFNTNHKAGKQHKTVTIHANTKNLTEVISFKAYNIPKSKQDKQSLKRREEILKNRINPRQLK